MQYSGPSEHRHDIRDGARRGTALLRNPFVLWATLGWATIGWASEIRADSLNFNRDIRPILSEHCFTCHGFDDQARKARLRLDDAEAARKGGRSGQPAIVPFQPDVSSLWQRVISEDPDERMPPPEHGKSLTETEKQRLHQWLSEGAEYSVHWSFLPPRAGKIPEIRQTDWPRDPLDHFILEKLESEGLTPQPEADRTTLARRTALDLTGLLPSPEELDAFLEDTSPNAYEIWVDRLLTSPHYGERMALEWLDAARYADTHGYHIDSARDMTAWRDGIIRSFNESQPFDQFTLEQLAGDLLPDPTPAQRIASGFNRNHMINYEGGAIAEEYHTAYIMDRINTTTTVWLGLTVACAQCHDHKYDPITMKDYYALYALFNNVPEKGLDGVQGNADPVLPLPNEAQQATLRSLTTRKSELEKQLRNPGREVDRAQAEWEAGWADQKPLVWSPAHPDPGPTTRSGNTFERLEDASFRVIGPAPATDVYRVRFPVETSTVTAFRVEVLPDPALPEMGPGRYSNGNFVLSGVTLRSAHSDQELPIASASATHSQQGYPIGNTLDGRKDTGWAILPQTGRPQSATFLLKEPWTVTSISDPNSASASGLSPSDLIVELAFESGFAAHQFARFRITTTDHPEPLTRIPAEIQSLLTKNSESRSAEETVQLTAYYREAISPELRSIRDKIQDVRREIAAVEKEVPSTMVMAEMETPRETFILVRGEYDQKGERVFPDTPAALPPMTADMPRNRLGLAQWLISPDQPLTARVLVNRFWQMLFGQGLVESSEDFGSQGDWPSHPELLDFLATEFVDSGWDVKALMKRLVLSATYRQSSAAPEELYAHDPQNALYARGARVRLHAEFIRDLALQTSGLLNRQIGGASVFPYQPAGLWEELMFREDNHRFTAQVYVQDHGGKLYRRSLYTFVKRTSPHPAMSTLDAPDRQVCTVRRPRTNTPLQALVLMNDPTFVEAARKLAERILINYPEKDQRLDALFRLTTSRLPREEERHILAALLTDQHRFYSQSMEAARDLIAVGESNTPEELDPVELATWTVLANAVLNLDETITKN